MLTNRTWIARAMVSGSPLVTIAIAVADPNSQHAEALMGSGTVFGVLAGAAMAAVSIVGLLDIFFNDRRRGHEVVWLHKHRHIFFLLIAASQMGLLFSVLREYDVWRWVMAKYVWDTGWAVAVACFGVIDHCRHVNAKHDTLLQCRRAGDEGAFQ